MKQEKGSCVCEQNFALWGMMGLNRAIDVRVGETKTTQREFADSRYYFWKWYTGNGCDEEVLL